MSLKRCVGGGGGIVMMESKGEGNWRVCWRVVGLGNEMRFGWERSGVGRVIFRMGDMKVVMMERVDNKKGWGRMVVDMEERVGIKVVGIGVGE